MVESGHMRRGIIALVGGLVGLAFASASAPGAQFEDTVILIPVGGTPNSIADGDFNGDNDTDIVAGRYTASSVAVSLGEPGFDFAAVETYPAGSQPAAVTAADLNGDGDPELLVGNRNSDNVSVLIGAAGGTFTPGPGPFPAGNGPEDVVVADFDGDGILDLAVTDFFSLTGDLSILRGTGGGNFEAPTTISTGDLAPQGVALGNFNGDGDPDIAAVSGLNSATGRTAIFFGGPGTSFSAPQVTQANGLARDVLVGDFNGDGHDDVATSASGTLHVLLGNGDGTFAAGPDSDLGSLGVGLASADFNGDKDLDLVYATGDIQVGVAMGAAGGAFATPEFLDAGVENFDVITGEYSDDSHPDFAVVNQSDNNVFVYRNTGETAQPPPGQGPTCLGKPATIVGTDGDDVLQGTRKADVISGLGGDDTLRGKGGKDRLCGAGGRDLLIGGPAKDKCSGGPAKDRERGCP